jgi:hypothetical protein
MAAGTACQIVGAVRFVTARQAILAGRSVVPSFVGPVALAVVVSLIGVVAVIYLAQG